MRYIPYDVQSQLPANKARKPLCRHGSTFCYEYWTKHALKQACSCALKHPGRVLRLLPKAVSKFTARLTLLLRRKNWCKLAHQTASSCKSLCQTWSKQFRCTVQRNNPCDQTQMSLPNPVQYKHSYSIQMSWKQPNINTGVVNSFRGYISSRFTACLLTIKEE